MGPLLQQSAGAAGQIDHVRRGDGAGITLRRVSHHPEVRSLTLKPSSWSFANRAICCTVDDAPQLYSPLGPLVLDHGLGAAEQGEARCTMCNPFNYSVTLFCRVECMHNSTCVLDH